MDIFRDQVLPVVSGIVGSLDGRVSPVPVSPVDPALTHVQVDSSRFVLLAKLHHKLTAVFPGTNLDKVHFELLADCFKLSISLERELNTIFDSNL